MVGRVECLAPQVGFALRLERCLIADEILPMKRFDEPDHSTLDEFAELVQSLSDRLERMEAKLDRLDTRLATLDQRLKAHERLTGSLIEQVIGWESRLSQRLDHLELALRLQDAS